jgi:hypothetical protein
MDLINGTRKGIMAGASAYYSFFYPQKDLKSTHILITQKKTKL